MFKISRIRTRNDYVHKYTILSTVINVQRSKINLCKIKNKRLFVYSDKMINRL